MSGYYNTPDSDSDDTEQDNTGKGLRKALESALEKIAKLESAQRTASATEVLKGNGLDPALADLIPEGTTASEWVEKYAHLLGVKKAEDPQGQGEEQPEVTAQAPEDEDPAIRAEREAVQAMQGAQQDGSPSVITSDVIERMNAIDNEAELMKFINSNGAG